MFNLPLIIGHRGCKYRGVRENSIKAVKQSLNEGVDIIELDIVCTKDGRFIGYHPRILRRMPPANSPSVNSLESLLKTLNSRTPVYIDIKKSLFPKEMDMLVELTKKYHTNQVIIGSFYIDVLRYFRRLMPNYIINYHCLATYKNIRKALSIKADWINPIPYFVRAKFVSEALRYNLKFVPAGNEDYRRQLRYAKLGAYALSAFKPAVFRKWLQKKILSA